METDNLIADANKALEDVNYIYDVNDIKPYDFLRYMLELAQTNALIAIAQELKRANDAHDTEIEWLENERQGLNG